MHGSNRVHWSRALRVLVYVKGVPGRDLVYRRNSHMKIMAFLDSRYVGDQGDRKSTSCFCTYVGEILLPNVAISRTLCLDPVQRLSIDSWLRRLVR